MSVNSDIGVLQILHLGREGCKLVLSLGRKSGSVGREEDSALESDLNGLKAVDVRDGFHLGVLHLFSKSRSFFVHLLANDGSCTCTYGRTDSSSDGGTLAVPAYESPDSGSEGSPGTSTYESIFLSVIE